MSPRRPHRVAVLVLPGVLPLEFGAVTQIFSRDPHYDLAVCAEARSVPGSGFTLTTAAGLEGLKRADTVIVPGYEDVDAVVTTAVLDALRTAHAKGVRLASICSGAFALASAGSIGESWHRDATDVNAASRDHIINQTSRGNERGSDTPGVTCRRAGETRLELSQARRDP